MIKCDFIWKKKIARYLYHQIMLAKVDLSMSKHELESEIVPCSLDSSQEMHFSMEGSL